MQQTNTGKWKKLNPNQVLLETSNIIPGYFYRAVMVFPANEIDEESPLNPPVFKGKHMTTMGVKSGLYKTTPGYARTILVTEVSKAFIIAFVCSSSPRDSAKRSNTHRWIAIEGSPVLPKQPPKPIRCIPEGSLSLDPKKEVYICFTHALKLTPVGQGEGLLPESNISIPWHPDRTTLNVADIPDPDMQSRARPGRWCWPAGVGAGAGAGASDG
jgi:hypothetical protein